MFVLNKSFVIFASDRRKCMLISSVEMFINNSLLFCLQGMRATSRLSQYLLVLFLYTRLNCSTYEVDERV